MLTAREACYLACKMSGWNLTNINLYKILYVASVNFACTYGKKLIKEDFDIVSFKCYYDKGKTRIPCFKNIRNELLKYGSGRIKDINLKNEHLINTNSIYYQEIETAVNRLKDVDIVNLIMFYESEVSAFTASINESLDKIPFEYISNEAKIRSME